MNAPSGRRTKIVSTVGPATASPDALLSILEAGTDVIRLNFSHGTREGHARTIETVREFEGRLGRPIAVLQDLAGPRVRIGGLAEKSVTLQQGRRFVLSARDVPGTSEGASVTYAGLGRDVRPGDAVFVSDGTIELGVESIDGEDVVCRVVTGGRLLPHKGVNVPGRSLGVPTITERDREDLAFGVGRGVDCIGLSFVRSAADVAEARRLIEEAGGSASLVAKIEKREALVAIDDIIGAADAVMVARGDLGVEVPIEDVPGIQKSLIAACNRAAKPVITATQMLESMVENARPTRAEATDIANAILDGTDALMLSAETAVGRHAPGAVGTMARVAAAAESMLDRDVQTRRIATAKALSPESALASSACAVAEDVGAAAIVTFTQSGATARLVARHRPRMPVFALTPHEGTRRTLALVWGVRPCRTAALEHVDEVEREAARVTLESGAAKAGDRIVITAGHPLLVRGNTNLIKVAVVGG